MENKKRLIDANALKKEIVDFKVNLHPKNQDYGTGYYSALSVVEGMLAYASTVDAVELPCRIGDSVWGIRKHNRGKEVKQGTVSQMLFVEDMKLCLCVKNVCRGEWGKNVFATKQEAEVALEGLKGDENG